MNIQIGDEIYTSQSEELKAALARAHAEKIRPICLCNNKHLELYIANINDGYFVKRMPDTGELHDADCDHFELDPMLSGRGAFESGAIVHDQDTNTTMLKLGFSLSQKIGGSVTVDREDTAGKREYVAKASMKKLSLRGLLDLMYDDAHLNRYYPAMAGKRFWAIIERELRKAAKPLRTAKQTISQTLFIPKYAKVGEFFENNMAFADFTDGLKKQGKVLPNGFVIGELHSIRTQYNRPRLVLRCLETPLHMDEKVYQKFAGIYDQEIEHANADRDMHLIVIARVNNEMSDLVVNQIAAMLVNDKWISVPESATEKLLFNMLDTEERAYQRVLRYGADEEQVMASVVLLDTEEPMPIFVEPNPQSDDEDSEDNIQRFFEIVQNESPDALILKRGAPFNLPPKRDKENKEGDA